MAYVTLRGGSGTGGAPSTVAIGPLTDPKALDVFGSVHDHFHSKGGVVVWTSDTGAVWVPATWSVQLELDRPLQGRRDDGSQFHGSIR